MQVKDVSRANCKGVVAASLDEVKAKSAEKFGKVDVPNIHLDSDGTEVDDEDYFQTLEPNTELVAVFEGEQWIDVSIKLMSIFCYIKSTKLGTFTIHINNVVKTICRIDSIEFENWKRNKDSSLKETPTLN